jgi:hypothetical protein
VGTTGQGGGLPYRWYGSNVPNDLGRIALSPGATGLWIYRDDRFGYRQTGYISTWDDTTGTVKGNIIVRGADESSTTGSIIFQVTTGHDRTTYWEFQGSLLVGATGISTFGLATGVYVNFVPKGDQGSINLNASLFETNSGVSHASNNTLGTDLGQARKVAFLMDDGSLTFDFIRNYDVFKPSDFVFSTNSFSFAGNGGSTNVLIGNSNYSISTGAAFSASLVAGPALTAQITVEASNEGVGFPIWFSSLSSKTAISGTVPSGVSITAGPAGSVTIRLRATGANLVSDTETVTYNFYNHIVYGVTSATDLNGATLTGSWVTRTISNSLDQTFTVNVPIGQFVFFGYPKRLGEAVFQINDLGVGGFNAQGYGGVPGVSSNSYSNMSNYTEDYYIYRSTNSGLGDSTKVDTGSSLTDL